MTPTNPAPAATPKQVALEAMRLAEEAKTAWGRQDARRLYTAIDALAALAQWPAATPLVQEAEPVARLIGLAKEALNAAYRHGRAWETVREDHAEAFANGRRDELMSALATGVQATEVATKCSPTLTECPRCKNVIGKCDGVFATEVASPVVGAASLADQVAALEARCLTAEAAAARWEAWCKAAEALATPSQQEDAQPVCLLMIDPFGNPHFAGPTIAGAFSVYCAAPPARSSVPLTDERILMLMRIPCDSRGKCHLDGNERTIFMARAIEAEIRANNPYLQTR